MIRVNGSRNIRDRQLYTRELLCVFGDIWRQATTKDPEQSAPTNVQAYDWPQML